MRRLVTIVVTLALLPLGRPVAAWQEPPPSLDALVGEHLAFELRWGILPAAEATLEVERLDRDRVLLRAAAQTLPYLDLIYPVRDLVESTVQAAGPRAERYFKNAREGRGEPRVEEILFDLERGTAHLLKADERQTAIQVPATVQDPLSCFYAYRTLDLQGDAAARLDVSDGKKLIEGVVRVVGHENIEVPAGRFDTVIIEPELEGIGGVFKKSPGARIRIWLSDDAWRRPVKLKSEVAVGSFTAVLTSFRKDS
jgi:hypothetical protein